ncbi:hypothetical protein [Anaerobutyricum hallii]
MCVTICGRFRLNKAKKSPSNHL